MRRGNHGAERPHRDGTEPRLLTDAARVLETPIAGYGRDAGGGDLIFPRDSVVEADLDDDPELDAYYRVRQRMKTVRMTPSELAGSCTSALSRPPKRDPV